MISVRDRRPPINIFYGGNGGGSGHSKLVIGGASGNTNSKNGGAADGSQRFVSKNQRVNAHLTEDVRNKLQAVYDRGTEAGQYLYDKLIPNGGLVSQVDPNDAYFLSGRQSITWNAESQVTSGRAGRAKEFGETWYHEHGHYIAFVLEKRYGITIEHSSVLADALQKDIETLTKSAENYYRNYYYGGNTEVPIDAKDALKFYVRRVIPKDSYGYSGVQDVVSGYYREQWGWGHSTDYWNQWGDIYSRGNNGNPVRASELALLEGAAHLFAAQFTQSRGAWSKYLPNTLYAYDKILTDFMVKDKAEGTTKSKPTIDENGNYIYVRS